MDKETLKKILDSSFDEIFVIDGKGVVVYVNKACERHYGLKASEFIGKSSYELAAKGYWFPSITPHILREKKSKLDSGNHHWKEAIGYSNSGS